MDGNMCIDGDIRSLHSGGGQKTKRPWGTTETIHACTSAHTHTYRTTHADARTLMLRHARLMDNRLCFACAVRLYHPPLCFLKEGLLSGAIFRKKKCIKWKMLFPHKRGKKTRTKKNQQQSPTTETKKKRCFWTALLDWNESQVLWRRCC